MDDTRTADSEHLAANAATAGAGTSQPSARASGTSSKRRRKARRGRRVVAASPPRPAPDAPVTPPNAAPVPVQPLDADARRALATLHAPAPDADDVGQDDVDDAPPDAPQTPPDARPLSEVDARRYIGGAARCIAYTRELYRARQGHRPDVRAAEEDAELFAGDVAPEAVRWPALSQPLRRVGAWVAVVAAVGRVVLRRVERGHDVASRTVDGQVVARG